MTPDAEEIETDDAAARILSAALTDARATRRRSNGGLSATIAGKTIKLIAGLLCGWSAKCYSTDGDQTIKTPCQSRDLQKLYDVYPDEFYSHFHQLTPITPDNVNEYLSVVEEFENSTSTVIKWDFWEKYSLSARLTTVAAKEGLQVGFPVDYRHGWNLNDAKHRALLDKVDRRFAPTTCFSSPECRIWGTGQSCRDPELVASDRAALFDQLEWLKNDHNRAIDRGGFAISEQL
jgi:hypothetical protein